MSRQQINRLATALITVVAILVVVAHTLVQVLMICMASRFLNFLIRLNVCERSHSISRSSAICRLR
mgnify:CR=1 FL=1